MRGERFSFDEDVWAEEVGRFDAAGQARARARAARARIERPGARIEVRACDDAGGVAPTSSSSAPTP
jgi:hypothetical protein